MLERCKDGVVQWVGGFASTACHKNNLCDTSTIRLQRTITTSLIIIVIFPAQMREHDCTVVSSENHDNQ